MSDAPHLSGRRRDSGPHIVLTIAAVLVVCSAWVMLTLSGLSTGIDPERYDRFQKSLEPAASAFQ